MVALPEFVCDLLVLAAFAPELEAVRRALGGARRAELASPAGAIVVGTAAVGVGMPAAGGGAYASLVAARPAGVVLVGTCGAYPHRGIALLEVVVAPTLGLADPAVSDGRSAFPPPMGHDLDAHAGMVEGLTRAGARSAHVATTLAITTDDPLAACIAEASGADVEHLEAYAVASACALLGVPFAAVLGVANAVGSKGREEWRAHNAEAGSRAAGVLLGWVAAGAPGLPLASPRSRPKALSPEPP